MSRPKYTERFHTAITHARAKVKEHEERIQVAAENPPALRLRLLYRGDPRDLETYLRDEREELQRWAKHLNRLLAQVEGSP